MLEHAINQYERRRGGLRAMQQTHQGCENEQAAHGLGDQDSWFAYIGEVNVGVALKLPVTHCQETLDVQTVHTQYARPTRPMRSRLISVVLGLAAAIAFAMSVQTAWWTIGEVDIGPFGARHCFGGECRESGLTWIGGSDLWMRSAVATRAAGFIAMFALLMFAGARAAKREPRLVARLVLASIVTAVGAGGYFAAAFPGLGGAALGPGLFFYAGAIVAGVAGVIVFLRSASR